MSLPISVCMIRKALTDDKTLQELQRRLKYNKKFGSMTIFPCEKHHTPECKMVSPEESEVLNKRLRDLDEGVIKA
jgi:hypothetical protein